MKPATRKRKEWLLFSSLLCLLAIAQVGLSHQRYELSGHISQTGLEADRLRAEIDGLGLELASLARPERLRQLARSKLGMGPPKAWQVLRP